MKKQFVLMLLILGSIATIPVQTHAESDSSTSSFVETIKTRASQLKVNKEEIRTNRKAFEEKFENITKYVKQDLTKDDTKKAKTIIEKRIKTMEELNKSTKTKINSGTQINTGDFVAKVTDIYATFKTEITPYIDPTKVDAFNAWIDERVKLISTNWNLRATNQEIKTTIETKKEEKKLEREDKKLEKEDKKEVKKTEKEVKKTEKKTEKELKTIANEKKVLKELIKKIDEIIKKTTTVELKDALISAKKIIEAKIPANTGTGTTAK